MPIIVIVGGMLYAMSGQGTAVKVDDQKPEPGIEILQPVPMTESTPVLPRLDPLTPVPDPAFVEAEKPAPAIVEPEPPPPKVVAPPGAQKINVIIWGPPTCQPCANAVAEGNQSARFRFTKRSDIPEELNVLAGQANGFPIVEFEGPRGKMLLLRWPGLAAFEAEYKRVWTAGGAGPKKDNAPRSCR